MAQAPLRPGLLVNARTSVPVQLREKVNVSARNDSASHVVRPRAQRSDGAPKGSPSELAPRCWPPQAGRSIEITYCRLCGWGLRAGWMAQELLTTFAEELGSVTLTPDRTGGVFEVRIDDELTGRGRSGAAFRKSRRSNSSSATASPPVARSGIRTPP
jgi:selenoprotein W-related protein